ncbi:MAG: polyamine aminopropyltransferase [bacterium]|nr:polyamine aminopropyltransferase [bacterium]
MRHTGLILKTSILATGFAGIVAEYVLSTLATYLSGNAVFQWTIVMSLMLFAMGVGSRFSKYFIKSLIETFLIVEICLSILCAASAALTYSLSAHVDSVNLLIYALSMFIGWLIGFEIPLVTRLNESYEELRTNIAGVMEKDYYGALLGGLFFAFVALPHLGLTYTPIVLGSINFLVAAFVWIFFYRLIQKKKMIACAFAGAFVFLATLGLFAKPIILFGEQRQYKDKVIYSLQTPFQKIIMTQWKTYYWLFINGQVQFSSFDEEKYHEPLVHPAMQLSANRSNVLILGGGDGLALREVLQYADATKVTLVDLDKEMTALAQSHPVLLKLNKGALNDRRVKVVNRDARAFLQEDGELYGVIIIDLPDPDTIDLMHLYSLSFYRLLRQHLMRGGVFTTQAGSPYFTEKAFFCIQKTIRASGFSVLAYHNQVPTMGEWGWALGIKEEDQDRATLKRRALLLDFKGLDLRFLNHDAMIAMTHFGKGALDKKGISEIRVNREIEPVLHQYYRAGTWGVF